MKKYFYIILSCILLFISCKNNNTIDKNREINKKPEIIHLQDTYYSKFYHFNNFDENETCIKYIFDFAKSDSGRLQILTDKYTFEFEDGIDFLEDKTKQRFSFTREEKNTKNKSIKVNFLENTPIHFTVKETEDQKQLTADFESLTVNTVQNFLDYAKEDKAKKEIETYTYILYNKNKTEKMKLIYHEYGAWFEVEIT